jgi:bifunctional non-homologous end joining protein LigD
MGDPRRPPNPLSLGAPRRSRGAPRSRAATLPDLSQYGQLAEYNRKRHFAVTPEPEGTLAPREPGSPRPLAFVVQKHRATRLHYDFRIEHRGVMLSWAVPKGPSLDPHDKRLAMQTEPHPLDYNQFEGVIPAGEYGGGTVMIWDLGVWAPVVDDSRLGTEEDVDRQLARGQLKFVLLGKKLAGSWVLVRSGGERQWLMIKHRDEYVSTDDVTVAKPRSVVSERTMAEIAAAAGASPRQFELAAGADPTGAAPRPSTPPRSGASGSPEADRPVRRPASRSARAARRAPSRSPSPRSRPRAGRARG